jgi:hypothetical protein
MHFGELRWFYSFNKDTYDNRLFFWLDHAKEHVGGIELTIPDIVYTRRTRTLARAMQRLATNKKRSALERVRLLENTIKELAKEIDKLLLAMNEENRDDKKLG